jgi:2-keto-4-pentenoate hydratase/2-oxohepta-3-ene-1,7-dioic acid hydratase in catechol pathway
MQTGKTAHMVFSVAFILSYVSQFMTLLPGDIVTTGTPLGTGFSRKPPVFLKAGDRLRLGIGGPGNLSLGEQTLRCIASRRESSRRK